MKVTWEQKNHSLFLLSRPSEGNLEIAMVAPHLFDQASKWYLLWLNCIIGLVSKGGANTLGASHLIICLRQYSIENKIGVTDSFTLCTLERNFGWKMMMQNGQNIIFQNNASVSSAGSDSQSHDPRQPLTEQEEMQLLINSLRDSNYSRLARGKTKILHGNQ